MDIITLFFAAMTLVGVGYLVITILFGGFDVVDIDLGFDLGDFGTDAGFGCSIIAAFLSGFGLLGFLGSLQGWSLPVIVGVSIAFGIILSRLVMVVLRYINANQSTEVRTSDDLIGTQARMTVDTPTGAIGEALVYGRERHKYGVYNDTEAPLSKGDTVQILEIRDGRLIVKKKQSADNKEHDK